MGVSGPQGQQGRGPNDCTSVTEARECTCVALDCVACECTCVALGCVACECTCGALGCVVRDDTCGALSCTGVWAVWAAAAAKLRVAQSVGKGGNRCGSESLVVSVGKGRNRCGSESLVVL